MIVNSQLLILEPGGKLGLATFVNQVRINKQIETYAPPQQLKVVMHEKARTDCND